MSTRREPPPPKRWLVRGFEQYARRYVGRHFHAVRVLGLPPAIPHAQPLVVYLNHPAWWDPLICLLLAGSFLGERSNHAPMAAAMLARYGFMRWLGFFPVEEGTGRGGAMFLRGSEAILRRPGGALWVTPQSRFADARERPPRFAAGLAHLARRVPEATYLPLALEFPFWSERTPEALVHFGAPVSDPADLEQALAAAQDELAAASLRRDPAEFAVLVRGTAGEGGIYEAWRRLRAHWRGERFGREHGGEAGRE